MYRIYADNKLLYAPHLISEGCGVLSPKLTEELNRADLLEYTMLPGNVLYDQVKKLKTIITVFQNGEEIFRGRVLYDEKDFYKQKRTNCEGELNFLLDSKQRPYTFNGTARNLFKQYISNHNARVDADKRFTVGNIDVPGVDSTISVKNDRHVSTLDEINEKLIGNVGGYLKVRGSGNTRYIDWVLNSGNQNTQTIEFGVNLLDLTEYISAEDIRTVLIPVGAQLKDDEGNTTGKLGIASVNGGKDYLENASAISLFGRIEEMMEWSEVEDATELKRLGEAALRANIELAVTLTVKAVDLHTLNVDAEKIRLGDWVRVISAPHGLDKEFQCTKITHDMVNPDQTEYIFGVNFTSLTEQQVNGSKNMKSTTSMAQTAAGTAAQSVDMVNQTNAQLQQVINDLPTEFENVMKKIYPIGAIYLSASSINPEILFGFGTWSQIKDRFLLSAGNTYSAGSIGGAIEHEHSLTTSTAAVVAGEDASEVVVLGNNTGKTSKSNHMPPYLVVYVWKRTA